VSRPNRLLIIIISLFVFALIALLPSCNQENNDDDDSDQDENDDDDDDDDDDANLPDGTSPHDECRRLLDDDDDDDNDDDDWWGGNQKDDDTVDDDADDDDDDVTPGENPRYDACYNCVLQCNLGLQSNQNFEDGPCLSNNIIEDWVCDIVHSPRNSADGLAINQCSYYPAISGHKIEVSTSCDFLSSN